MQKKEIIFLGDGYASGPQSIEIYVSKRISELALIEPARPGMDDEEVNELCRLTEFMGFPMSVINGRIRREVGCQAARECLPTPLV